MHRSLASKVWSKRTLVGAWLAVRRNGRLSKSEETRQEIKLFDAAAITKLDRLTESLRKGTFRFAPAKGIPVPKKGKKGVRPIVLAPVETRIVQRAVHDVLAKVPKIKELVKTTHSFGGVAKEKTDTLSAVPAAVQAVLSAIANGGRYIKRSDIQQFFTKIPKSQVTAIVAAAVNDAPFIELFKSAIAVELDNMAWLRSRGYTSAFPIEDIGVAQGNSLSSLLGNLLLKDFDETLNAIPGIRCIRYIDDFILIGPNRKEVEKAFTIARLILSKFDMTLATGKTEQGTAYQKFQFLGIEFDNGLLRPSLSAQQQHLNSIRTLLDEGTMALQSFRKTRQIEKRRAFIATLGTVDGKMQGWGVHYRFCNDGRCFESLDAKVYEMLKSYMGVYRDAVARDSPQIPWTLMGIQNLSSIDRHPFEWRWK